MSVEMGTRTDHIQKYNSGYRASGEQPGSIVSEASSSEEQCDEIRDLPHEPFFSAIGKRLLQSLARSLPGAFTLRVWAHRMRGVHVGRGVHIAPDVVIETAYPQWVWIGNNVQLGMRALILAHIHSLPPRRKELKNFISVRIEDDVYIGAATIILPHVKIGRGAVVTAGSVVTKSVAPMMMVQGNPAEPIAECGIPLTWSTPIKKFYMNLRPLNKGPESKKVQLKPDDPRSTTRKD